MALPEINTLYDDVERAPKWAQQRSMRHFHFPNFYQNFRNRVKPGDKMLEIGVGHGRDIHLFEDAKLKYYGVDLHRQMLGIAHQNEPSAYLSQQNLFNLGFPSETFDNFWISAVYHHVEWNKIDLALQELHRVCKPEAIGFISLRKGRMNQPFYDDQTGLSYHPWRRSDFAHSLKKNDFRVVQSSLFSTNLKKTVGHDAPQYVPRLYYHFIVKRQ